ncbi:MAG: hypothetical protein IJ471_00155 [Eubacterium sp.]|nr:hypothetical protein [Eubacterium sp.]
MSENVHKKERVHLKNIREELRAKQVILFIIGLFVMGLGIVLIKKANLGLSPISAIPAAVSNIVPLTFGNVTIIFQCCCFAAIMLATKKLTWKRAIILPVGFGIGYILDLYNFLLHFDHAPVWGKIIICMLGIMCTALGIVIIKRAEFVLPAADELWFVLSHKYNRKVSQFKTAGDIAWVVITVIIEVAAIHKVVSVGIGTVLSMLLTGFFVGKFQKYLPTRNKQAQNHIR